MGASCRRRRRHLRNALLAARRLSYDVQNVGLTRSRAGRLLRNTFINPNVHVSAGGQGPHEDVEEDDQGRAIVCRLQPETRRDSYLVRAVPQVAVTGASGNIANHLLFMVRRRSGRNVDVLLPPMQSCRFFHNS